MKKNTIKIYITKNLRTKGIQVTEGTVHDKVAKTDLGMFHKPDWYTSESEAKAFVEHKIMLELKQLEKTMKQLKDIYEAL